MELKLLETFEFVGKTENRSRLFLKNLVRKMATFFAQDVRAIKSIESLAKDIAVRGVNIPFMISLGGGLISYESLIRNGSGSLNSSRLKSLPERLLNKQGSVTL